MKPEWKDAPEWAQWLVIGSDWKWMWFEVIPIEINGQWIPEDGSRFSVANPDIDLWKYMEQRPK